MTLDKDFVQQGVSTVKGSLIMSRLLIFLQNVHRKNFLKNLLLDQIPQKVYKSEKDVNLQQQLTGSTTNSEKEVNLDENFDEKGKLNIEAKTGVTIILLSKC